MSYWNEINFLSTSVKTWWFVYILTSSYGRKEVTQTHYSQLVSWKHLHQPDAANTRPQVLIEETAKDLGLSYVREIWKDVWSSRGFPYKAKNVYLSVKLPPFLLKSLCKLAWEKSADTKVCNNSFETVQCV